MKICPSCHHRHSKAVRFCKKCGKSMSETRREARKGQFLQQNQVGRSFYGWLAVAVVLVAAGTVIIYFLISSPQATRSVVTAPSTRGASDLPMAAQASSVVTMPVAAFNDGKAHFFNFRSERGAEIRYFLLKSSDGIIRAAFDACDVCYRSRKGYRQEGDEMVCNNCGQRFPSIRINEVRGGCNPAPLDRQVAADQIVIQMSDILQGALYFI